MEVVSAFGPGDSVFGAGMEVDFQPDNETGSMAHQTAGGQFGQDFSAEFGDVDNNGFEGDLTSRVQSFVFRAHNSAITDIQVNDGQLFTCAKGTAIYFVF